VPGNEVSGTSAAGTSAAGNEASWNLEGGNEVSGTSEGRHLGQFRAHELMSIVPSGAAPRSGSARAPAPLVAPAGTVGPRLRTPARAGGAGSPAGPKPGRAPARAPRSRAAERPGPPRHAP